MTSRRLLRWVVPALLLLPRGASAWDARVHELMPERALQGDPRVKTEVLPAVTAAELDRFRLSLDTLFRAHPDEKVRAEYLRRWPTPETFDARAFKTLMALNPARPVNGFDVADGLPGPPVQVMRRASAQPDTDGRNQDRLAPQRLPDGRVVPVDPIILNLGAAQGVTSQNHAHAAFAEVQLTDDPDMLKRDPRRFAWTTGWPGGNIRGFAREQTQAHYDLAVLAAMGQNPSLSHLFFGHALHYLADAGQQTQTVQVGLDAFYVNAKLARSERALKTLGGYLGELRSTRSLTLDMMTTHKTLASQLITTQVLDAAAGKDVPESVKAALGAFAQDDGLFKQDLEMSVARSVAKASKRGYAPLAALISSRLIDATAGEGSEVYRHILGSVQPRMSNYGVRVDAPVENLAAVLADESDPYVKAHLESFYWLHAKAFARIGGAYRLLFTRFLADTTTATDEERTQRAAVTAQGLLTTRLKELQEQEVRLETYLKAPPPVEDPREQSLIWLLGPLFTPVFLLAGLVLLIRWMRKPVPQHEKDSASYM